MKVAIDATSMPPRRLGVARYITSLLSELAKIAEYEELDLFVLTRRRDVREVGAIVGTSQVIAGAPENRVARIAWEQAVLPRILKSIRPDVLHCPHYSMPYLTKCPCVVVLHDATFFSHPEFHEPLKRRYFQLVTKMSIKRADRLVTISQSSRNALCEQLAIDAARIDVIPLDDEASSPASRAAIIQRLGIAPGPYALFLGTIQPRKNLTRLVEAFDQVRADGVSLSLVIAGDAGWMTDSFRGALAASRYREDIDVLGYVDEVDRAALLEAATMLVYPSIAEGFGLPVIEAMAAGTPVVTSFVSATAEIGGDAVCHVDPLETASIAEGIRRVATDKLYRQILSQAGVERAKEFTWTRCAEATIATWRRVLT